MSKISDKNDVFVKLYEFILASGEKFLLLFLPEIVMATTQSL